jgi:hypothetical protein
MTGRVAKELADKSGRLAGIKGEVLNWLSDLTYGALA